jgi:hypothetical protein
MQGQHAHKKYPGSAVMLLVILVVIFLWRQGENGDNNESRIAIRYSPC